MGLKFLATKGLGLLGKSKTKTLDALKPTLGKKETTTYLFNMAKDRLSKNIDKLKPKRGKK